MKLTSASDLPVADKGPSAALVTAPGLCRPRYRRAYPRLAPLAKKKRLRLSFGAYRGHAHDEHASLIGAAAHASSCDRRKASHSACRSCITRRDVTYLRPLETSDKQLLPDPPDPLYPIPKDAGAKARPGAPTLLTGTKNIGWCAPKACMAIASTPTSATARAHSSARLRCSSCVCHFGPITLQPCLRAEWLDADLDRDVGTRRSYTLALQLIFDRHVRCCSTPLIPTSKTTRRCSIRRGRCPRRHTSNAITRARPRSCKSRFERSQAPAERDDFALPGELGTAFAGRPGVAQCPRRRMRPESGPGDPGSRLSA